MSVSEGVSVEIVVLQYTKQNFTVRKCRKTASALVLWYASCLLLYCLCDSLLSSISASNEASKQDTSGTQKMRGD